MPNTYKSELKTFSSLLQSLEKIPAIGKKSAFKIAYNLGVENKDLALKLAQCIEEASVRIRRCSLCRGISEGEICQICSDPSRETQQICIVLHPKDIFTIEESNAYQGRYFVLEDREKFDIKQIQKNITSQNITEVIFAFPPNLANEAIMLLIENHLKDFNLTFSKIAQGVPTNIGLENVDSLSLSRALLARTKI